MPIVVPAHDPGNRQPPCSFCVSSQKFNQNYLSAAVHYLEDGPGPVSLRDIRGIWVASDDPNVLDEVRVAAPAYFPRVGNDTVVWASGGVGNGLDRGSTATHTSNQVTTFLCLCHQIPFLFYQ